MQRHEDYEIQIEFYFFFPFQIKLIKHVAVLRDLCE